MNIQKQPPKVFYKKAVLKNLEIFTGKHLCRSFFLIKLLYQKKDPTQMFACEYCEIFKNIYFEEHIGMNASDLSVKIY